MVLLNVPALDRVRPGNPLAATCRAFHATLFSAPAHDQFDQHIARRILALPAAGNDQVIVRFRLAIKELEAAPWATRQWAFRYLIRRFGEVAQQEKKACLVAIIEDTLKSSTPWGMEVMRRFARRLPASDIELHDWLTERAIAIDPEKLSLEDRTARAILLGTIAEKAGVHSRPCSVKRWKRIFGLLPSPGVQPSPDCETLVWGLRWGLFKLHDTMMDGKFWGESADYLLDISSRIPLRENIAETTRAKVGERYARQARRRQWRELMQPPQQPLVLPLYLDRSYFDVGGGGGV